MKPLKNLILPDWPAPKNVSALSTTRLDGVSEPPFDQFNLALHVGDDPSFVEQNRANLRLAAKLPEEPNWLEQIHGSNVVTLTNTPLSCCQADACYSDVAQKVCVIMTADCLPVLFCSQNGKEVAVAHAGWRGLSQGVLENTLAHFKAEKQSILAWLGPAIGPSAFEVGQEVYQQFVTYYSPHKDAFTVIKENKYLANIYQLAKQRLLLQGIRHIYGGDFCTFSDKKQFFSYRRDKMTGRMATLIWFE